jgi:hypothetical protein
MLAVQAEGPEESAEPVKVLRNAEDWGLPYETIAEPGRPGLGGGRSSRATVPAFTDRSSPRFAQNFFASELVPFLARPRYLLEPTTATEQLSER